MNRESLRKLRPGFPPWIMWCVILSILLIPAIAMRFTREVNWTAQDFLAAAILLGGAGLVYQFAVSRVANRTWRVLGSTALLTALVAIWAEGAIGIF